jgi:outer membrane lipoprotein-sorting protein
MKAMGLFVLALFAAMMSMQPAAAAPPVPSAQAAAGNTAGLDPVLNKMDAAAASFKSADADFAWDQFEKVIEETTTQKGHMYFRRNGAQTEMAADITGDTPGDKKNVLYTGDTVRVYQPNIDQVTQYSTGKDKATFESFMVLGFGGRGHDLLKNFDVTFQGNENVGGVNAAKLQLVPKTQKARNVFDRILLWIDPARGISVQQQFFEPSGNYRLAKYSNIRVNEKISDDVFKLKTTSRTKVVNPQG